MKSVLLMLVVGLALSQRLRGATKALIEEEQSIKIINISILWYLGGIIILYKWFCIRLETRKIINNRS